MDVQSIIITICGLVFASTGLWQLVNTIYQTKHHKSTKLEDAVMCILHDRVYFLCRTYLGKDSIAHDDYDNLNKLYEAYASLGGNGTAERLMIEVNKLPIVDD